MARIIGGIGASHTPTIGFARDRKDASDPVWGPLFEGFAPVTHWLEDKRPDALVFIYNDHVRSFFFDHYSAFALGIGDSYPVADEGGEARTLPPVPGDAKLAQHIGASLIADEFDMSFFQRKGLDHGCLSPLSMMLPFEEGWPIPIVPLAAGVLQFPIPSALRFWKLGVALRRAIESYPEDIDVAIVATGGLSHQVHGARAGFNNPEWDARFLDLIETDPEVVAKMTHAELARLGGFESTEVVMWLIMRAALGDRVACRHRSYYLPSMTAIATVVFEPESPLIPDPVAAQAQLGRIGRELEGIETLEGTMPFTQQVSVANFGINDFLHRLTEPSFREAFRADPEVLFASYDLSSEERRMIREFDWKAMNDRGVIFFLLEKLGAVVGASNLHIYAAMRGETLEVFQQTRNAPGALYSVAGGPTPSAQWEAQDAR